MAWPDGGVGFVILLVTTLIRAALCTDSNSIDNVQDSVKWVVSEFGACSTACGGGIRVRTVWCVSISHRHGISQEKRVPEIMCPLPAPALTSSCNNHKCTAHWTTDKWLECSATCGTGTQTREVKCQSLTWQRQRYYAAETECGGSAPDSFRKCHMTDCPFSDKAGPHSILSENYTLIQLHRTKKIKVNIGGQVNILPGQTVVVKCPVKNYSKKLLYWSKGYKLVPFMGRVRSTPGGLHISKGNPRTDAGIYKCIAGGQSATITVTFIEKDDPSTRMYKKWIQKSNRQHQKHPQKYKDNGHQVNDIWITASSVGFEELNQQRDQSHNSSNSLTYVISDWSSCSATCRAVGHRKRKVSCTHVTPKFVKVVPDSECQLAGLDKPETTDGCTAEKECATWRKGPWLQCLQICGKVGYTSRTLTCVWESSGQPAGAACDSLNKPAVSKPCKNTQCLSECNDDSRYCSLASLLKLCRFHYFQRQCCTTCQVMSNSTS